MPIRVPVTDLDLDLIETQAQTRHQQMHGQPTSYGRSTPDMQRVGLLGEHAVATWLATNGHPPRWIDDPDQWGGAGGQTSYDLSFISEPGKRTHVPTTIEVKTNRYSDWFTWGRSISAKQLARTQAHTFTWCVVADDLPTTSVILMGWCPTQAILDGAARHPDPTRVVATEPLREMPSLLRYSGWQLRRH